MVGLLQFWQEFLLPEFIFKKKICVATMAKTQQSFFNYYNEIVSFCDKIELGAAYFLHNLITFFIPSRQRISEQIPYLCWSYSTDSMNIAL